MISGFSLLFSGTMTFIVGCQRAEVFAGTITLAAVQVVFVGGVNMAQMQWHTTRSNRFDQGYSRPRFWPSKPFWRLLRVSDNVDRTPLPPQKYIAYASASRLTPFLIRKLCQFPLRDTVVGVVTIPPSFSWKGWFRQRPLSRGGGFTYCTHSGWVDSELSFSQQRWSSPSNHPSNREMQAAEACGPESLNARQ